MWKFLVTCEHASHRIPRRYARWFEGAADVVRSHRGWDPGTSEWGKFIAQQLQAPYFATDFSRLLIEPNRTLGHPAVFSEFTRHRSAAERQTLVERFHLPHWDRITRWLEQQLLDRDCRVIHLGVHSFTPQLHGRVRNAEIGLLYDSRRGLEKTLCQGWQGHLRTVRPDLRVRRNYPYLGRADGLTTALRRRFPADRYLGIELEFNQSLCVRSYRERMQVAADALKALHQALNDWRDNPTSQRSKGRRVACAATRENACFTS